MSAPVRAVLTISEKTKLAAGLANGQSCLTFLLKHDLPGQDWRGAELKPYGKDANFVDECVGCHRPLEDTNYVFTEPIRGQR